jgi:hypothetical protein
MKLKTKTLNLGRLRLSRKILSEQPEDVIPVFVGMVVIEAQMRWEIDGVEYLALSDRFDPVPEGVSAPSYEVSFRRDEKGNVISHEINKSIFS